MKLFVRGLTDPLRLGSGSASSPTYSFSSESNTGFLLPAAGAVDLTVQGTVGHRWSGSNYIMLAASPSILMGASSDVVLTRDAAAVLAIKNSGTAQEIRCYGTTTGPRYIALRGGTGATQSLDAVSSSGALDLKLNGASFMLLSSGAINTSFALTSGQLFNLLSQTELTTIASAATSDTTISVPAGAVLLAASVRVVTSIPTAATFTVTTTVGGTTLSTAAVATAAGSTDSGTAAGASYRAAATNIRITPNLTPATATGQVRVTIYYYTTTPPTS